MLTEEFKTILMHTQLLNVACDFQCLVSTLALQSVATLYSKMHFNKISLFCPFLSSIITKSGLFVENSADPDETPCFAASHLALHCLLKTP